MTIHSLLKRIDILLSSIEKQQQKAASSYCVIVYDPATGLPLPGFEPPGKHYGSIRIPDNGRDNYATFWLPVVEHERGYKA